MNPLIALSAGDFPSIAERFQQGQQLGQQNALRAALQQYGGPAMMGDQNALQALAQYDPTLAMGLRSDQQQMDLRNRADNRDERSFGLERLRSDQTIAESNARMAQAEAEAARATELHKAKMSAADFEAATRETQLIIGLEGIESPDEWDAVVQRFGADELVGQFEKKPELIGMARGVQSALVGSEATTAVDTLHQRAIRGGLVEGSPEYQDFMRNGPVERTQAVEPTFRMLTPEEAEAANVPQGSQKDEKTGRVYPAESRDTTTEGERKAAGFYQRMQYAEDQYNELPPSGQRHNMAQGAAMAVGVPEGWALTGEEERGRQFQIDWVRAKLRAESGAVIGEQEAWEEAATYFPRPGDGPERIKAKAESRQQALEQMKIMAGREAQNVGEAKPAMPSAEGMPEIPPEIMQQLQQSPPGTVIRGRNGEVLQWDGQSLNPL